MAFAIQSKNVTATVAFASAFAFPLLIWSTPACAQSETSKSSVGQSAPRRLTFGRDPNYSVKSSSPTAEQPAGVGLLITSDKGHYVVQYVLPDMSAARASVAMGDVVLAVDDVSVDGLKTLDELVAKIRGANGSSVKLTISTSGKTRNVILTRSLIPSKKQVVDVDYGREKSVWFYQREDIIPSDMTEGTGMYGDGCVRNFLRQGIGR